MPSHVAECQDQFPESLELDEASRTNLRGMGYAK